jgi:hypothetical protein
VQRTAQARDRHRRCKRLPIAVAGSIGYIVQGLRAEGLPAGSFGYIYLPALGFIVVTSMLVAPLGARLMHWAPVDRCGSASRCSSMRSARECLPRCGEGVVVGENHD